MPGFPNIGELASAELAGQQSYVSFRKVPAVVTVSGTWYDYSMAPGNPSPQYYAAAPLVAQVMAKSTDGGINHGGSVSPLSKYLRKLTLAVVAAGGVPQRVYLLDYLMFYPFCDMGSTDPQSMTNSQSLTRYTTGDGVQIMAVLVAPHSLASDTFIVTYTNQSGTAGRTTLAHRMTTSTSVNGTLLTSNNALQGANGPFMTLQAGDTGVRSIQSVQCVSGTDVGLFTLVLVKPLAEMTVREITSPVERDFFLESAMKLPQVVDDAYLNFITCPTGSLSAVQLLGDATFIWE